MRHLLLTCLLLFAGLLVGAQQDSLTTAPTYNKALADSLGADEYGMRMYQFVILKTGPSKLEDQQQIQTLFRGHMENINRLVDAGKLIVAGPFAKNEKAYRGLFILKAKDRKEAAACLETDPAIEAGLLEAEIFDWYGAAALPLYLPYSKSVTRKSP
ncbi:hypothetical protein GCM10027051_18490 [Niabella terrae]